MKKIELMKKLEAAGLGFTANVIMNGCGKPTTKMRTLVNLIAGGAEVRHAPHETLMVVVNGRGFWMGALDRGAAAVLAGEGAV